MNTQLRTTSADDKYNEDSDGDKEDINEDKRQDAWNTLYVKKQKGMSSEPKS